MLQELKQAVCSMRLDGATIYEIADALGISQQAIADFFVKTFSELPLNRKPVPIPDTPKERMMDFCNMRIANKDLTIEQIAECCGASASEVTQAFTYLRSRVPPRMHTSIYPAVNDWMRRNGVLMRDLATQLGLGPARFSAILRGMHEAQMPFEVAEKISQITGLSFNEIYRLQIEKSEMTTQRKED